MTFARLAEYLRGNNLLSEQELQAFADRARTVQAGPPEQRRPVGELLVETGRLSREQAYAGIAFSQGWAYLAAFPDTIPAETIDLFEPGFAREHTVVPVSSDAQSVTVAMPNPGDKNKIRMVRGMIGGEVRRTVNPVYTDPELLRREVQKHYSEAQESAKKSRAAALTLAVTETRDIEASLQGEGEIAQALNSIFDAALSMNASDIHLEPTAADLSVRFSVDGKLRRQPSPDRLVGARLIALIKTRAKLLSSALDTQNGVISHAWNGSSYDLRVAVLPAVYGESVTLRMGQEKIRALTDLGFTARNLDAWDRALNQPNGIVIACGPMGSGKSTLHLAGVGVLREQNRKIVTLEDPVEMKIPWGVTQVSISERISWEDAMATTLRSAASVLFLGEINKEQIAHTAVSAALSGHLVLSTLHTNDAPGVVVRLREMGIRPSVLADSLRAVCAQRLPRMLCSCRVEQLPSQRLIEDFRLTAGDLARTDGNGDTVWWGPRKGGCDKCNGIGYAGRIPIHELMTFPAPVRDRIAEGANTSEITQAAKEHGMLSLADDGLAKAMQGLTSLEEVRSQLLMD